MRIGRREANGAEDDALGQVMHAAIHASGPVYSAAERHAWSPEAPSGARWQARLAPLAVLVARAEDGPVGFMARAGAYVDLAFVAPGWQRRGVFAALLRQQAQDARAEGLSRLWTHASLTAQPAFLAAGFRVIRHEKVARAGEVLARAEMERRPL